MLFSREVPVAPQPLLLARRLVAAGREPSLLHAASRGSRGDSSGATPRFDRWSYVAADPDGASDRLDPLTDDEAPEPPGPFSHAPRWVGVVPYEARRSLERAAWTPVDTRPAPVLAHAAWCRHASVVCVDHHTGRVVVVARDARRADQLAAFLRDAPACDVPPLDLEVVDSEPPGRHVERIVAAQALIRRGDLYQVNLARALRLLLRSPATPAAKLALYARLVAAAPTAFASFLMLASGVTVASTSPELLLRASVDDSRAISGAFGELLTVPIKGTRPRGAHAEADRALAAELDADPKERAELAMIVDVERNDLARVSEVGSVRLVEPPHVVTYRTVHHREATLRARALAGASREAVLAAMVPSGSVTGAPKVRAMEVIASLEPRRRGLYTGAIGMVAQDGSTTLAMAIRTLVLGPDGEGEYLTGGGIVEGSEPARELEETGWKALQLRRAAGGGAAGLVGC